MPASWIEHQGRPILFFDDRDQRTDEALIPTLEAGSAMMQPLPRPALTGITGLKIIFFNAYLRATGERSTRSFSTREEALDFLVG